MGDNDETGIPEKDMFDEMPGPSMDADEVIEDSHPDVDDAPEIPKASKSKSSKKLEVVSYQMTSGEIKKKLDLKEIPGFRNKRQLCEWLEKNKKAVVEW